MWHALHKAGRRVYERKTKFQYLGKGPSIKYVTLFLTNLTPPSLCHTLSHISEPPHKVRHIPEYPPKDCPASICASELCKEHSYEYRITVLLHCIVKKIVK